MRLDSAFFILCFLPLLALGNALLKSARARSVLLLAGSLAFLAFGSLSGLDLFLASTLVNYLLLAALRRASRGRKALKALAVCFNLAFLAAFKYLTFLLAPFLPEGNGVLPGIAAPIGLSFFTFKAISCAVDTARDRERGAGSFWEYLLYLSFFPQLTAGPITRWGDFRSQLSERPRQAETLALGLRRFFLGLGKKLILAGAAARAADPVFGADGSLSLPLAWLGAVAYLLQIYFDFSGYSDMAIGLGTMFGFRTPENFDYPYAAVSITDFWRRWHISLSLWFRDYLYIPLGGNRRGKARTALNKLVVFALCGLWHGGAWTFVLWGLWHGLFSALESLGAVNIPRLRRTLPGRILSRVYALAVVCLGFVLFRADSLASGWRVLGAMFGACAPSTSSALLLRQILQPATVLLLILGAVLTQPVKRAFPRLTDALDAGRLRPLSYALSLALFVLCLAELASGGFAPFIYAQF